jgi:hypothetical protein
MADTNSTQPPHDEIIYPSPVYGTAITRLLKTPLGTNLDLFQLLDCCQKFPIRLSKMTTTPNVWRPDPRRLPVQKHSGPSFQHNPMAGPSLFNQACLFSS